MANNGETTKGHHHVEGPKNHYITYIASILLTMLAFTGVIYGGMDKSFLILLLFVLGTAQACFQLFVWMHAKDRGHALPIVGLIFGLIVALTAVASGIWFSWI